MLPRTVQLLAMLACACVLATPALALSMPENASRQQIEAAFRQDGFSVVACKTFGSGFGCRAQSNNVTVLNTGAYKYALYVSGSAYEMGYLTGFLAWNETRQMAFEYVDRFIPALLAPGWFKKHENTTLGREVMDVLGSLFTDLSVKSFNQQYDAGVFPEHLVEEMNGVVAGCNDATPIWMLRKVPFQRLVTLNFGMDWLSTLAFSGRLDDVLRDEATRLGKHTFLAELDARRQAARDGAKQRTPMLKWPVYCDAFGVWGECTKGGDGMFMGRDFQLPTGDVFQDVNCPLIYHSSDPTAYPLVAATAPGLVGSITAMNNKGVAMGVDTLRAGSGDLKAVGFNSALLVRHTVQYSATFDQAKSAIASAHRGCPWLYPVCGLHNDQGGMGECAIFETGAYRLSPVDPLSYIYSKTLMERLPSHQFLQQHSNQHLNLNGAWMRQAGFDNSAYMSFNKGLFELANLTRFFNASGLLDPTGSVLPSWEVENSDFIPNMLSNYLPPARPDTRKDGGFVVVANHAVVPEAHLAMMYPLSDLLEITAHATQWRFDTLNRMLSAQCDAQSVDWDGAMDTITFLSPERQPGYWMDRLNPNDPMSAQIEGCICLMDVKQQIMSVKAGYWRDGWLTISLPNYV